MPRNIIKYQEDRPLGVLASRTFARTNSTAVAAANRSPANVNGGRKSRPILIPSQVEPQMRHRAAKTSDGPLDGIDMILVGLIEVDRFDGCVLGLPEPSFHPRFKEALFFAE